MWPQGLAIYLLLVIVRGGGEVVDKVVDKVEDKMIDKVVDKMVDKVVEKMVDKRVDKVVDKLENLSRVEEEYSGKISEQQLVGRRSRAVQHFEQPTTLQRMLAEARQ